MHIVLLSILITYTIFWEYIILILSDRAVVLVAGGFLVAGGLSSGRATCHSLQWPTVFYKIDHCGLLEIG